MSPDKVLQKIHAHVKGLVPALEGFVEDNIQPTVNECENIQSQLIKLQEELAVYKYLRESKELSPGFHIHAKVSEAAEAPSPQKTIQTKPKENISGIPTEKTLPKEVPIKNVDREPIIQHKTISVGLNDKFRFINELFSQNITEYSVAIEQLNTLITWQEAEIYLNSLKNLYQWSENSDITRHFYVLVKKRFD